MAWFHQEGIELSTWENDVGAELHKCFFIKSVAGEYPLKLTILSRTRYYVLIILTRIAMSLDNITQKFYISSMRNM